VWLDRLGGLKRLLLFVWRTVPTTPRLRSMLYWLISTKYGIGVQAVVFDEAGRLLLLRHTYKGRYPWGLPGGGMSRGETTAAAALRELREEAGLDGSIQALLGVETHPHRLVVEIFYLCRVHGGEFRPNAEIAGCGYFALDALPPDLEPRLRRIILAYTAAGRLPVRVN
jgi:8-oxo-dGTP diphosphatase